MGPDGAIYIADWYNPIIQHGEVDFRDPRRDHTHGRIWRVTAKGRPLVPKPKLVDAPIMELFDRMKDPEDWTRQQAKRVIMERPIKDVMTGLSNRYIVEPHNAVLPEGAVYFPPHYLLEMLWVCRSVHHLNPEPQKFARGMVRDIIASRDPNAIAAVIRVMSTWPEAFPSTDSISPFCRHEHPRVRLEAIRALAASKDPRAVEFCLASLDLPSDKVLDYALWLAVRELEPIWMPAFREGKLTFGDDINKLTFTLQAVGSADAIKPVLALIESKPWPTTKSPGSGYCWHEWGVQPNSVRCWSERAELVMCRMPSAAR